MLHERSSDVIGKFVYRGQLCIGQIPRHLTYSPPRGGGGEFDNQSLPESEELDAYA